MHIPNSMLSGPVCPFTAIISALGVFAAAFGASRAKEKPTAAKFGAITALIFAGQMINFPIQSGTSGHLLGGVLAVALLGLPFGILAMALVLLIQCVVFADGGFTVLGANVLNMSIIGAGLGGLMYQAVSKRMQGRSLSYYAGLGAVAWISVMAAALACSIELAVSGTISFSKVAGAMLGTHALIGVGEGLITVAACYVLSSRPVTETGKGTVYVPLAASVIIGGMLSPFASVFPDGLEWVAEKYNFLHESAPLFVRPLPDYTVPSIGNEMISTAVAGLLGVFVTYVAAWILARVITPKSKTV